MGEDQPDPPSRMVPRFKLNLTSLEGRADTAVAPMSRRPDRAFPIKTELRKFCPVSKMLRRAGMDIAEIWNMRQS